MNLSARKIAVPSQACKSIPGDLVDKGEGAVVGLKHSLRIDGRGNRGGEKEVIGLKQA